MNASPIPQGLYKPAKRTGRLIFTAGMTPRVNGVLMLSGPVDPNLPIETYKEAVRQAARNALTAAENVLNAGESIEQVLSMCVYVNAPAGYTLHTKIADFASQFLYETLGEKGVASRAALGMSSLPGNAPIEISLVLSVAE